MLDSLAHYADFVGIVSAMTYSIVVGIVYALAIARLTRLINADTILDRPRAWIAGRVRTAKLSVEECEEKGYDRAIEGYRNQVRRWSTAFYFVQCPWCVGMWLAFGTAWAPIYLHENPVVRYVSVALAVSHLVGVCARFADTEEIDYEDETVN